MEIVHVTQEMVAEWAQLCCELWPDSSGCEMQAAFANGEHESEYLAKVDGAYVAFISLSVRRDYVEGTTGAGPVGYLEGIYVRPAHRRQGIAKQLVNFAKDWSVRQGCSMLASDCILANEESRRFHNSIGFAEASINVHFTMPLH